MIANSTGVKKRWNHSVLWNIAGIKAFDIEWNKSDEGGQIPNGLTQIWIVG